MKPAVLGFALMLAAGARVEAAEITVIRANGMEAAR